VFSDHVELEIYDEEWRHLFRFDISLESLPDPSWDTDKYIIDYNVRVMLLVKYLADHLREPKTQERLQLLLPYGSHLKKHDIKGRPRSMSEDAG
jgi:hypothetical protein